MFEKKWIFILLVGTLLWAENNQTDNNTSKESNTSSISTKILDDNSTHSQNNISTMNSVPLPKVPDINQFHGAWHLRVMDGMDVRKARAILDFTFHEGETKLSGFDGCNRLRGDLIIHSEDNITVPVLTTTRMACRQAIHRWVSKRLHTLLKEGYSFKAEKRYGIEGMTLKSPTHELFFKKMGKE